ncbi:MAG: protease inhibitor I42 family protein [Chloroflexi bacterium]|nr:protease inhibitor I42 family protein [Chloroflexota bacterium]
MRVGRFAILLLAGVLAGGCGAAVADTPAVPRDVLTVTCDELAGPDGVAATQPVSRSVTVAAGETFRITLCSNPSTGFAWETPVIAGTAGVTLVDHQTAPASGSMPGAAGAEAFTFRAASAGTATIDFAYSRPWEGGEKAVWTVQVSVDAS